jgi:hypothetical protein
MANAIHYTDSPGSLPLDEPSIAQPSPHLLKERGGQSRKHQEGVAKRSTAALLNHQAERYLPGETQYDLRYQEDRRSQAEILERRAGAPVNQEGQNQWRGECDQGGNGTAASPG